MPLPEPDAYCITTVENRPGSFKDGKLYEPFGFRDGIAQPVIRGLRQEDGDNPKRVRQEAGAMYEDRLVDPGEFVLGYRNGYDELTYCPDVEHWTESGRATHPGGRFTLNGSYLAVRQIQQDVDAFNALAAASPPLGGPAICEKLMGRSKNGLPLSWTGDQNTPVSDFGAHAFRYQVEDANGSMCPQGAHIRRVNPRDSLGVDVKSGHHVVQLHRLLRRGRPYREETGTRTSPSKACSSSHAMQISSGSSSSSTSDGCVTSTSAISMTRTIPSWVRRRCPRSSPFRDCRVARKCPSAALTQTLGGGYFFLPGIKALEFIVAHGAGAPATAPA